MRRVHDLGVELDTVEPALAVLEGGNRGRRRAGSDLRSHWRRRDRVAVTHPYGLLGGQVVEELRLAGLELGLAELGCTRALDHPAEVARHELHAVADAERRDPEREDLRVEVGSTVRVYGCRPAGEDERRRVPRGDLSRSESMPYQLRVDARLAHAPGDQLAVLPA